MLNAMTLLGSLGSTVLIKFWPKNLIKRQVIFSFTDLLGKPHKYHYSYGTVRLECNFSFDWWNCRTISGIQCAGPSGIYILFYNAFTMAYLWI